MTRWLTQGAAESFVHDVRTRESSACADSEQPRYGSCGSGRRLCGVLLVWHDRAAGFRTAMERVRTWVIRNRVHDYERAEGVCGN